MSSYAAARELLLNSFNSPRAPTYTGISRTAVPKPTPKPATPAAPAMISPGSIAPPEAQRGAVAPRSLSARDPQTTASNYITRHSPTMVSVFHQRSYSVLQPVRLLTNSNQVQRSEG